MAKSAWQICYIMKVLLPWAKLSLKQKSTDFYNVLPTANFQTPLYLLVRVLWIESMDYVLYMLPTLGTFKR